MPCPGCPALCTRAPDCNKHRSNLDPTEWRDDTPEWPRAARARSGTAHLARRHVRLPCDCRPAALAVCDRDTEGFLRGLTGHHLCWWEPWQKPARSMHLQESGVAHLRQHWRAWERRYPALV